MKHGALTRKLLYSGAWNVDVWLLFPRPYLSLGRELWLDPRQKLIGMRFGTGFFIYGVNGLFDFDPVCRAAAHLGHRK